MRHAWAPKFQLSGPTVHSYNVEASKDEGVNGKINILIRLFRSVDNCRGSRVESRGSRVKSRGSRVKSRGSKRRKNSL